MCVVASPGPSRLSRRAGAQTPCVKDQHLQFAAQMSLNQCAMTAQPYIAQWINDHPNWMAVRWHCEYGGGKEKI
jgi:hypothetical protein